MADSRKASSGGCSSKTPCSLIVMVVLFVFFAFTFEPSEHDYLKAMSVLLSSCYI